MGMTECPYCGMKAPKGHWRPFSWLKDHLRVCEERLKRDK